MPHQHSNGAQARLFTFNHKGSGCTKHLGQRSVATFKTYTNLQGSANTTTAGQTQVILDIYNKKLNQQQIYADKQSLSGTVSLKGKNISKHFNWEQLDH